MHHIQKTILIRLGFANELRFSELKPGELENKLFDYHLKQVIRDGFVAKNEAGLYTLTTKGKQWGIRALTEEKGVTKAHSVLFLIVRRKLDDAWLLYKRSVHPLKDKIGFPHASPVPAEDITITARHELLAKTNLTANFKVLGSGYSTAASKSGVESFTHYELLVADDCSGALENIHERAEYYWQTAPDWDGPEMLPNMPLLIEKYNQNKPFFSVNTFTLG